MKLTPEQEFLEALAKHFDVDIEGMPLINERRLGIIHCAKNYLQSLKLKETDTVKPEWKPEVGKLYQGENGIIEITAVSPRIRSRWRRLLSHSP